MCKRSKKGLEESTVMVRQGEEREISLVDLFFHILLRWRMIFVCMFIGAILFGAYSYYDSLQMAKQQKTLVENQKDRASAIEALQDMLTTEQLSNVNRVLQYEALDDYFNQSILMKINPSVIPCSKLIYIVKSESVEESKNIRQVYEELISGGFLQWLEENTEEAILPELNELITVNGEKEKVTGNVAVLMQEEGTLLEINVIHSSEKECIQLVSYLKEYIECQEDVLKGKIGEHELVYIAESFKIIADSELTKNQMTMLSNIEASHKAMKTIKDGFSSLESRYYILCSTEESYSTEQDVTNIQKPAISVRYVALGMVVFAFLYVFLLFLIYIMNTKIRITDDMNSVFAVAQLGKITKPVQKKRLFGEIDSWIYKLQNRNKRIFSKEEGIGLAISAIKIAAKKDDFSSIICMGTAWNEKASEIAEKIKMSLAQEGISVRTVKNVLYDKESLELLEGATGAFLLECADTTFYDEVWKELELLQRQEIKCLGIVVVEV